MPLPYLLQLVHYVACLNAKKAYIAVLIGGNDYREFIYERDEELETYLIQGAKNFWEYVQKNVVPPPTQLSDLTLLYPESSPGKKIIVNEIIKTSLKQLRDVKKKQKELMELEKTYKFQIMEYMQTAECLTDENDTPLVKWKMNKRGTRNFLLKEI